MLKKMCTFALPKLSKKDEKNIPTFNEKKSEQARFPQENVHRQR